MQIPGELPESMWDIVENQESAHGRGSPAFCGLGMNFPGRFRGGSGAALAPH